jgi:hypothetical protein
MPTPWGRGWRRGHRHSRWGTLPWRGRRGQLHARGYLHPGGDLYASGSPLGLGYHSAIGHLWIVAPLFPQLTSPLGAVASVPWREREEGRELKERGGMKLGEKVWIWGLWSMCSARAPSCVVTHGWMDPVYEPQQRNTYESCEEERF